MKYIPLAFVWLLSLASFAQTAQISGLVQSASNEALPGASILLVGTVRGVQSNNAGQYILKGLKPGRYTIKVSFVGLQ